MDKSLGYFRTPRWLVEWMVALASPQAGELVLEPACGDMPFVRAVLSVSDVEAYAVDVVKRASPPVGVRLEIADFLLWSPQKRFDVIIGNPPYGIPTTGSSHYPIQVDRARKEMWKRTLSTWKGKYNLYAAFMEKAVRLLKPGGRMVFVVPGTFLMLPDFSLLRKMLASSGRTEVFYLGKVFPGVAVSAVVVRFLLGGRGLMLMERDGSVVLEDSSWDGGPVFFRSELTDSLEEEAVVTIGEVFDIRISPRSTEIKRSPLVSPHPVDGWMPVLDSRHLLPGAVRYELPARYYVRREDASKLRSYFSEPRVVVGHGYRSGRVAAAYDSRAYPWWGDVYHLLPKGMFSPDPVSLVAYLISDAVKRYVRDKFRDITYHLSSLQIGIIPLPQDVFVGKVGMK